MVTLDQIVTLTAVKKCTDYLYHVYVSHVHRLYTAAKWVLSHNNYECVCKTPWMD